MVQQQQQCPVCTLYLHAGMNLFEHLETHPKEHVIKALVSLSTGVASATTAASSASATTTTTPSASSTSTSPAPSSTAAVIGSEKRQDTTTSTSENSQSSRPHQQHQQQEQHSTDSSQYAEEACHAKLNVIEVNTPKLSSSSGGGGGSGMYLLEPQKSSSAYNMHKYNGNYPPISQNYASNSGGARTETNTNTTNNTTTKVFGHSVAYNNSNNNSNHNVNANPPTIAYYHHQQPNQQQQQQQQHKQRPSTTASLTYPLNRAEYQTAPADFSRGNTGRYQQEQQHHQQHQQHQQQQQFYAYNKALHQQSSTPAECPVLIAQTTLLPSQLVNHRQAHHYQQQQHLQSSQHYLPTHVHHHQQLSHNHTHNHGSSASSLLPKNAHNTMIAETYMPPMATATATSHKTNSNSNSIRQPPPLQQFAHQKPPPAYGAAISQIRSQYSHQQQQHSQQQPHATTMNYALPPKKSGRSGTPAVYQQQLNQESNARRSATPGNPLIERLQSPAITPRPASVLRYADSPPVAHFMERDNGDFVVQETPKHIVEYVETDNGQLSLTERIHQSPPSVLRIYDGEEDGYGENQQQSSTGSHYEDEFVDDVEVDAEEQPMRIRKISCESSRRSSVPKSPRRSASTRQKTEREEYEEFLTASSGDESDVEQVVEAQETKVKSAPEAESVLERKPKRHTITVLSDVQVNISECLDLVGITMPLPKLLKVEDGDKRKTKMHKVDDQKFALTADYEQQQQAQPPNAELQSHATTSVIRMATSPGKLLDASETIGEVKVKVEKNTETTAATAVPPALPPKSTHLSWKNPMPKKLIIKKLLTPTESSELEQPSTSAAAAKLKSEPITHESNSILARRLNAPRAETSAAAATNEEAQLVLTFAERTQLHVLHNVASSGPPNGFPSPNSVFASKQRTDSKPPVESIESYQFLPDNSQEQQHQNHQPAAVASELHDLSSFNDFHFLCQQNISVKDSSSNAVGGFFSFQQQADNQSNHATRNTMTVSSRDAFNEEDSASSSVHAPLHTSTSNDQQSLSLTSSRSSWCQQRPAHSSDFNPALAVDCSAALQDVADVVPNKFMVTANCKVEQHSSRGSSQANFPPSTQAAQSFVIGNECSSTLVGSLNICTDEKMPAKGEISEQESNGDLENSWSRSTYDETAPLYDSHYSGGFPREWNYDLCFPSQSLSSSETKTNCSFQFQLADEDVPVAGAAIIRTDPNLDLFSHQATGPSTSSSQRTCTVTSSQHTVDAKDTIFQDVKPTTSAAAAAAVALVGNVGDEASSSNVVPPKLPCRRIYKCARCTAIFAKLKDRSNHMMVHHNYIRRNRRLIPTDTLIAAAEPSAVNIVQPVIPCDIAQPSGAFNELELLDYKTGIVKIKTENSSELQQFGGDSKPADEPNAMVVTGAQNYPYSMDVKRSDMLMPPYGSADLTFIDDKKHVQPRGLVVSTQASKFTQIYQMLLMYNNAQSHPNNNYAEIDKSVLERSIFVCYICKTDFPTVKLYDAHLTEHPAECFTCGKKFYRWKNFTLHLKRHIGYKEFGCQCCDKKFVVRSALVEHMRMHTGQAPLNCNICGKKFKRYSNLTQHRKRHGKQVVRRKQYVCHCGEVLATKARLLWHKETHDVKPKCCPHCCDRFVHMNSLRRHIRLAHSDRFTYNEPVECPTCNQKFAKTSIKAHMATHGSNAAQFDCNICSKTFSTRWNLKMHLWVHANRTAMPYKCEHCPKAFVRELDFKNHMNAHRQIKPYTCEYCGCKFIRKYNYMRHRREHHGAKKFLCEVCDKSFHRHYYLIEHRRIHTGERPFQCNICGKTSTTKTNHNKHMKIHHSRDPFTAEV